MIGIEICFRDGGVMGEQLAPAERVVERRTIITAAAPLRSACTLSSTVSRVESARYRPRPGRGPPRPPR